MPIQRTGLMSRRDLEHPEEVPSAAPDSLREHVLKYNPNHGPDGRFASSGGGRRGGTAGAPTEDAFDRPLKGGPPPRSRSGQFHTPGGTGSSAYNPELRRQASNALGYRAPDGTSHHGFLRTEGGNSKAVPMPNVNSGPSKAVPMPNEGYVRPGALTVPKQFAISNAHKIRNYKEMFGSGAKATAIHYSDETLTPTGKKGVVPSRTPSGAIYNSDGQTLIPHEKEGTYIDKDTGHIYQSDAAERKAQAVRDRASDAAKQTAYVAAYGKKKRKK